MSDWSEGYPPGSLGYEVRRILHEAEQTGDPDLLDAVLAFREQMAAKRDSAIRRWLEDPA